MDPVPAFGKEIRESLFLLEKGVGFTNHGSFGTVPKPVFEAHTAMLREVESNPDEWFRWKTIPLYKQSLKAVAEFVGAPEHEVALVENATTGVTTILRSLKLGPGSGVLITSLTYDSCMNAAQAVCNETGATYYSLEIKLPIVSKESIVEQYRRFLEEHPDVVFVLVDHITSPSTILMPVKEIASLCRSKGVRMMVDGAHAPGQLELRLSDIGADYYTGWLVV